MLLDWLRSAVRNRIVRVCNRVEGCHSVSLLRVMALWPACHSHVSDACSWLRGRSGHHLSMTILCKVALGKDRVRFLDELLILAFRKRVILRDLVELGFRAWVERRLLGGVGTLHHLREMGKTTKEEFVVVRVTIRSLRDTTESPTIRLTNEGREFTVLEVGRDDLDFELTRLPNTPRSSVWHPGNDMAQVGTAQDGKHLNREVGKTTRSCKRNGRIWIRYFREVSVIEVGCNKLHWTGWNCWPGTAIVNMLLLAGFFLRSAHGVVVIRLDLHCRYDSVSRNNLLLGQRTKFYDQSEEALCLKYTPTI